MSVPEKILLIDDEIQIQRLLKSSFLAYKIKLIQATTGAKGMELCIAERPEVIILDIGLPDMTGLEVLRELRTWTKTPIIMLSSRDEEETIVSALENGADDYVTKPFTFGELFARTKLAFKRSLPESGQRYKNGILEVDFNSRLVFLNNQEITLTSTEYDLLKVLIRNSGKVVTHRQLLKEVWGPNSLESPQYLRVYVGHLRQKIEVNPQQPIFILTETGIGYRFKSLEGEN